MNTVTSVLLVFRAWLLLKTGKQEMTMYKTLQQSKDLDSLGP
jgi:hypothetical protein